MTGLEDGGPGHGWSEAFVLRLPEVPESEAPGAALKLLDPAGSEVFVVSLAPEASEIAVCP